MGFCCYGVFVVGSVVSMQGPGSAVCRNQPSLGQMRIDVAHLASRKLVDRYRSLVCSKRGPG